MKRSIGSYRSEKRSKELARLKKQEAKLKRRQARNATPQAPAGESAPAVPAPTPPEIAPPAGG